MNFFTSPAKIYLDSARKAAADGELREALGQLSLGFSADASYKPLYELAVDFLRRLDSNEEAKFFEAALENFEDPAAFSDLGNRFFFLDRHELSVAFYEKALQLAPDDLQIATRTAKAYTAQFQPDKGREILSRLPLKEQSLTEQFWAEYGFYWCSLLCNQAEGIEEFLDSYFELINPMINTDMPGDYEMVVRLAEILKPALDRMSDAARRLKTLPEPKPIVQHWHFIQYAAAVLNYFDEISVAGGRYVYLQGSNSQIAGILRNLKRFLENSSRYPQMILGMPDRDSEIIARAAGDILDLPVATATEDSVAHPYCLIVAADNRLVNFPSLIKIQEKQTLFSLNLNWLSTAFLTPDVAGVMSQMYLMPWEGGGIRINQVTGEVEETVPDQRSAELIAKEIALIEPDENSGINEILDFYKEKADYLVGGKENSYGLRLPFMIDSPVPGAKFS